MKNRQNITQTIQNHSLHEKLCKAQAHRASRCNNFASPNNILLAQNIFCKFDLSEKED
jgi:hypothetical protein